MIILSTISKEGSFLIAANVILQPLYVFASFDQ